MNQPPRKLVKSNSAAELTPEQIYDIVMGKDKGGIQGRSALHSEEVG